VTDYRWVRSVAERRRLADVARGIEQLLAPDEADKARLHEAGSSSGVARGVSRGLSAMNEKDVRELFQIAYVLRWEIPSEAAKPQPDLSQEVVREKCDVHPGEWSVGDCGLAHRIKGGLGFSCSDGGGAIEAATVESSEAGRIKVINALVASVRKHAHGRWLCPKRPCFVGLDHYGLTLAIRRPD
jgi:hypothetical protein